MVWTNTVICSYSHNFSKVPNFGKVNLFNRIKLILGSVVSKKYRMKITVKIFFLIVILLVIGCNENDKVTPAESCVDQDFFSEYPSRNFNMGFSTWIYAPNQQAKNDTYQFTSENSDIYSEHIDDKIPWNAWINNLPLPVEFTDEIVGYVNQMELVTISYYPFFKGQHSKAEFQKAFDFLHSRINKPVAFVETSHLAEDLSVSSFNLFIEGDTCEQNAYLETLLTNAREQNYEFVIWWVHRDFDALWQTFPEELKDLGKLWRNTGVLDDNGNERPSYLTWRIVFDK